MLGSFRFLLAWIVMLSHLPFAPFSKAFNPAVSGVVMFYFISGFLMYHSFNSAKSILKFYKKRFFRLYPVYFIVLTLTILAITLWHNPTIPLLNQHLDITKLILNYLLVFNNYVFAPFTIHTLLPHPLIPPTWSLSTEIHFYILVPFLFGLLQSRSRLFYVIFLGSMIFEFVAFAYTKPTFNSDIFGYRYIFGVLWIFMFGFLFGHDRHSKFIKFVYVCIVVYFMFVGFYFTNHAYVKEILLALLFLPLILVIKDMNFKYDKLLGSLSYPIFISHFFVFYVVSYFTHNKILFFAGVFIGVLGISIILAKIQNTIYQKGKQ
ncbi:MAG: acyltransferase [Epsilonproteobacteria bacterium]|nr:acyltransferase [Campylobacterota bacterium]